MIIDEIREQRACFETQLRAISKQTTTLTQKMSDLNTVPPSDPVQSPAPVGGENATKMGPVDMLEMYLRPLGALGPDRPSERLKETFRQYGRRPPCEHDHSSEVDQSEKSSICCESCGKAYFDLEKGLWLRPSSPGSQVYFAAEQGKWVKSTFEPVHFNI